MGVESTTRIARLTFKNGVGVEQLPHQHNIWGGTALDVLPGRAPLCLRCKVTKLVQRECCGPRSDACRQFVHLKEDCIRVYAGSRAARAEQGAASSSKLQSTRNRSNVQAVETSTVVPVIEGATTAPATPVVTEKLA